MVSASLLERKRAVVQVSPGSDYRTIEVTTDGRRARVRVRDLERATLPALIDARIAELATERGLTERERRVFELIVDGRALDDITRELRIAPRTAKFHRANILAKLGIEGRLGELVRLLRTPVR